MTIFIKIIALKIQIHYVDLTNNEFIYITNNYNLPSFITQSKYTIEWLQDINNKNEE